RRRHRTPRSRRRPGHRPGGAHRRSRTGRTDDRDDPHPRPRRPGRGPARPGRPRQLAPLALVRPEPPACRRRAGVIMETVTYWTSVGSPVGPLLLTAAPTGELTSLSVTGQKGGRAV